MVVRWHRRNWDPFLGSLVLLTKEVKNRFKQKPEDKSLEIRRNTSWQAKRTPAAARQERMRGEGRHAFDPAWRSDT